MGENMVLPKLVYKGCDNPKKYLEEQFKDIPKPLEPPKTYEEVKEILRKQDNYDLPRPELHAWLSPFWEEHKKLVLEYAKSMDICRKELPCYQTMDTHTMIKNMYNVTVCGSYSEEDIDFAQKHLGVVFAEDFKQCAFAFGKIMIHNMCLCDIYGPGGMLSDTIECRKLFSSLDRKYYALCGVDCDTSAYLVYFQDFTGCVYGLDRDGVFEPVYLSWKEFLIGLWRQFMEGIS